MIAAAITAAGCSSTDDTPQAVPVSHERTAVMIPAAPGEIDPGEFETTPSEYRETAEDPGIGSVVESQRMAEFLVLPAEIDPALTEERAELTRPLQSPGHLTYVMVDDGDDDVVMQIANDSSIYAGFATARSTKDKQARMVHAVFQMHDEAAASDAAVRLHDRLRELELPELNAAPHPIGAMPDSLIYSVSNTETTWFTSLTPHGHYLIYTQIAAPADRASWAEQALEHTLVRQTPLIDQFPFTTPDGLADLPMDIDGLLHRALTYPTDAEGWAVPAVYGPRGAAHQLRQLESLDAFTDTGVTHMSRDGSFVYRTEFADRAPDLFDRMVAQTRNQNDTIHTMAADGPPGVPDARCFEIVPTTGTAKGACVLLYGRYVAEMRGSDLAAAHQMTAAQYLIFEATDSD